MQQRVYYIRNLGCANCAAKMEAKINALPQVEEAIITFAIGQLRVTAEDPEALFTMGLHEFIKLSRAAGALLIQAHPFRVMCDPADPADLDGIEVRNMHPGHNSRNHLAQALADEHPHLLQTGGSDCHQESHLGRGGILSDTLPKDEAELVALLKSGKYEIIGK